MKMETSNIDEKKMNRKVEWKFWVLIALVLIMQFSFFGFQYFAVADDNNQLRYFPCS